MRRLPTLKAAEIIGVLERAGFCIDHVQGSHYQMYHPLNQRRVTVPYHGKRDVRQSPLPRWERIKVRVKV